MFCEKIKFLRYLKIYLLSYNADYWVWDAIQY